MGTGGFVELDGGFLFAFGLTLLAGLSTGIGSLIALLAKRTNTGLLAIALGFSAGVMIYVSFMEILPKANESLAASFSERQASLYTALAFFGGIALIALIDRFVPEAQNPHEARSIEDMRSAYTMQSNEASSVSGSKDLLDPADDPGERSRLMRMGLMSALAIGIHNFPEGLATFVGALKDPGLGIPVALAIAIHNIPEGIAVSIPVYYATLDRWKAFRYSFYSGLSEPLGALIGFGFLYFLFNDLMFGILFGMVAGIMVYISLDELLPTAEKYGQHHMAIYGLISGMAIMAMSLLIFI